MHRLFPPLLRRLLGTLLLLPPRSVFAQEGGPVFTLGVCWPGIACKEATSVLENVINALFISASSICFVIFLTGAAFMVFSAGNDTPLQKGKGMMTGSLIGLAVIVGAYGIYRTVVFFLYQGAFL